VAVKDKEAGFTALLHHVGLDRLRAAYWAINPKAAPGVDRVMWAGYGRGLEGNLRDLHERVQAGRYRAVEPGVLSSSASVTTSAWCCMLSLSR
jgi:hypothetical protein